MLTAELLKRGFLCFLHLIESGPAQQKVARDRRRQIIKPASNLGGIGLQKGAHPITEAWAVIDELSSVLDQQL